MFVRTGIAGASVAIAVSFFFAGGVLAAAPVKVEIRQVAFDRLIVLERPSQARQLAAADGLALPETGVDVAVHCLIEVDSGRLSCDIRDYRSTPVKLYVPAVIIAEGYRVQTGNLRESTSGDQTGKVILTTDMTVHVGPAPAVDLNGQHSLTPASAFNFVGTPSAPDAARYYPDRAQRLNRGGVVSVDCKVLDDLSLACPGPAVEDPPDLGFGQAAQRLALFLRSAPTLKDGQAAVGRWVALRFAFKPPG